MLGARCQEIDSKRPLALAEIGSLHQCSQFGREVLAAAAAAAGLRLAARARLDVQRSASRAAHAAWPANADEPLHRGGVIRQHIEAL